MEKTKNVWANNEKGITLVALVITIIVLVILVGVSVSTVLNTGLIGNSKNAVEQYEKAQTEEEIEIDKVAKTLDAASATQITAGGYAGDSNRKYVSGGKTAYIPAGFTVSYEDTENTIDKGLVIYSNIAKDVTETAEEYMAEIKKGTSGYTLEGLRATYNQFVWIPVEDPSDIYGTITEADVTLNPNQGLVVGEKYGKLYDFGNSSTGYATSATDSKITALNLPSEDGYSNNRNYREPASLEEADYGEYSEFYNKDEDGNKIITKEGIKNEFSRMIASVEAYGGFYIGRYELTGSTSSPTLKKGETPLTNISWYQFYTTCQELEQSNDKVKAHTTMIWGCQWDQAVKKSLSDKDDFLSDFENYGVYYTSSVTNSGTCTAVYNIYDMGGNVGEKTLEADGNWSRGVRGCGTPWLTGDYLGVEGANMRLSYYAYNGDYPIFPTGCRAQLYL